MRLGLGSMSRAIERLSKLSAALSINNKLNGEAYNFGPAADKIIQLVSSLTK